MDYNHLSTTPASTSASTSTSTSTSTTPNVTITILPVSLSLIHIPRTRLKEFSHPIIHQILRPTPLFLNISCNDTEVSIIAERETVGEFVEAAKRDWKKMQGKKRGKDERERKRKRNCPVEVSSTWSALQIDSHGDQIDDASARIREISALLKGISILYQSSYATDFIFVQSARLPKVIAILTEAKFLRPNHPRSDSFSAPRRPTTVSPPISSSHSSSSSCSSLSDDDDDDDPRGRSRSRPRRRNTTATTSSQTASSIHASLQSLPPKPQVAVLGGQTLPTLTESGRPYSFSPTSAPKVSVLSSDLVVVGLSGEELSLQDVWATKLIKLLLFSEDVEEVAGDRYRRGRTFSKSATSRNTETMAAAAAAEDVVMGLDLDLHNIDIVAEDDDDDSFHSVSSQSRSHSTSCSCSSSRSPPPPPGGVHSPSSKTFFSLTRTTPPHSTTCSTSLATDIHLLAVLFPAAERQWIFCDDEFERLDAEEEEDRGEEDEDWEDVTGSSTSRAKPTGPSATTTSGFLKCLHVDLQDFGLDRHGLVNRFSALLHEAGIYHLYSSTFKTANLLVGEKDADRALEVLRSCVC